MYENHVIWSELGPYGSVLAHIKTGRSPMAHDHFQTPPDPKRGYKNPKISKKVLKSVPNQPRVSVKKHQSGCLDGLTLQKLFSSAGAWQLFFVSSSKVIHFQKNNVLFLQKELILS